MTTTRLASQLAAAQLMLVFREGLVGSDRTQGVLCPVPQPNRKSTDRQEQFLRFEPTCGTKPDLNSQPAGRTSPNQRLLNYPLLLCLPPTFPCQSAHTYHHAPAATTHSHTPRKILEYNSRRCCYLIIHHETLTHNLPLPAPRSTS